MNKNVSGDLSDIILLFIAGWADPIHIKIHQAIKQCNCKTINQDNIYMLKIRSITSYQPEHDYVLCLTFLEIKRSV